MSLQEFSPDALYCSRCHAKASGVCAVCRALICADCAELSGGSVARAAVCLSCFEEGKGVVTASDWYQLLKPVLWAVVAMFFLSLSLVALLHR